MNCLVAHLCLALCDPLDCSMPGFPVLHHFLELAQTHARWCHGRWCHPTILSSVIPFSSCHLCFPASRSFPMSQLFASGGQSIGASASASALPMTIQGWFPLGLAGLISLQSKSLLQHHSSKASILQYLAFFMVQISHPYMITGKTIALTIRTFITK